MEQPVRVKFRKLTNGKIYLSDGYYRDAQDFKDRNCTMIFVEMTTKTKPEINKKEK